MSPAAPAALRAIPTRAPEVTQVMARPDAVALEGGAQGDGGAGLDHGGTEHVHGDLVAGDGGGTGHAEGDAIGPALGPGGGDETGGGDGAGGGHRHGENGHRGSSHGLSSGNGRDGGLIGLIGMVFQPGQGLAMNGQVGTVHRVTGGGGEVDGGGARATGAPACSR